MEMSNMVFASQNKFSSIGSAEKFVVATSLFSDDEHESSIAESLSKGLAKKLGKPIYCSCNIPVDISTAETVFLHKELFKLLESS